jgi:polyisoprenyl-teichoic acid--peptidoglycan teichoic acid transferase
MTITRRRYVTLAATLLVLAGCSPTNTPTPSPEAAIGSLPPSPSAGPTVAPSPTVTPTEPPNLSERPFTVLVLGGDNDFRTDSIMVVGIDPIAHTLAMASIPRDTINMPLPGGGTFTRQKINAFYDFAASHPVTYPQGPGRATADMVGIALGIKIYFYAATTFQGFINIVNAFGGVKVTLPAAVSDPVYQVTTTIRGIRFPKGAQTLTGPRALIYVRTRHGDNDFERQRRQQFFLISAGHQLLANPAKLAALIGAARNLITDFPLIEIPGLLTVMSSIEAGSIRQAVLGPTTYEEGASCPCGYALSPKLPAMKKLAATYFPWAVVP